MTKLDRYMQHPSVANEPMPLREVHAIRLMIYDETKGLTFDERSAYHAKSMEEAQQVFGIKFV